MRGWFEFDFETESLLYVLTVQNDEIPFLDQGTHFLSDSGFHFGYNFVVFIIV